MYVYYQLDVYLGSQSSVVVKRPHCNDKDVGSNPTIRHWGTPLQKLAQGSEQDLSGKPAMLKRIVRFIYGITYAKINNKRCAHYAY